MHKFPTTQQLQLTNKDKNLMMRISQQCGHTDGLKNKRFSGIIINKGLNKDVNPNIYNIVLCIWQMNFKITSDQGQV